MVITRRQSGKLPPALISESLDESGDEEGEDATYDDDNTLERRPTKKAKSSLGTENIPKPVVAGRLRRASRLAILPTMPLDILYEVFGHLHPLDLLNVSRTNKELRRILMSRHSTAVWKSSRRRIKNLPSCPDDLSEPQYARLAFETNCHGCGRSRTFKIDWALRIRGCQMCLRNHLVWSAKFEKRFPDFPLEIMDLLPYTKKSSYSNGHDTKSRFFWEPAILTMAERLEELEDNIMLKEAGATETLEQFKAGKKAQVQKIFAHARLCEDWTTMAAVERSRESLSTREQRRKAIVIKLQELNWTAEDISAVYNHSAFGPSQLLSDRIWARIRPELEAERLAIIERRKQAVINQRRGIVSTLYNNYVSTTTVSQRAALPRSHEVHEFKGFAELIGASTELPIQAVDFDRVMKELPLLIANWASVQDHNLISLLPEAITDGNASAQCTSPILCSEALAHTCPSNRPYTYFGFGSGSISGYNNCPRNFTFWGVASDATRDIVLSLGLDPHTITGDDLDLLDARLLCLECVPIISKNNKQCRKALDWRSCVGHFCTIHPGIIKSKWLVLDKEQTLQIKKAEGDPDDHRIRAWYCGICPDPNPADLRPYQLIIQHLQTIHEKTQFVLGVDIRRDPNVRRADQTPLLFGDPELWPKHLDRSQSFQCMHCSPESKRLFIEEGVCSHLRAKHNVTNPGQPKDYTDIRKVST